MSRATPAAGLGPLAVVMPCFNEVARVATAVRRLLAADWISELIVVDGGSDDGSWPALQALAAERGGASLAPSAVDPGALGAPVGPTAPGAPPPAIGPKLRLIRGPRGRGQQLNQGAEAALAAGAEVLLFLHVDCVLPPDAGAAIGAALVDPGCVGGAFRLRTVADVAAVAGDPAAPDHSGSAGPWWLRLADVRARYTRTPYGDQALFVRAAAFRAVGGYPNEPLMEDLLLSQRLRQRGRLARLRQEVRASGRRFLAQPVRSFVLMNTFPLLLRAGVSPRTLAEIYGHIR